MMKTSHVSWMAAGLLLALATVACGAGQQPPSSGAEASAPAGEGSGAGPSCSSPIPDGLRGQAAAEALMAKWKAKHPGVDWEAEERASRTFLPSADNTELLAKDSQKKGHPYRNATEQDLLTWKRETERLVVAGSRVFHSAEELGSTIAVSCDMCHPNAANTHPETYPKFQTQIGKVVLLRDMINWCLEQAARAPRMDADDPRMRAMEAYIISQRAGQQMQYGKH